MLDIVPTITTGGHWEKSFAIIFPKHFEGLGFMFLKFRKAPRGKQFFVIFSSRIERVSFFRWLSWSRMRWEVPRHITTTTITVVGGRKFHLYHETKMGNEWMYGWDGWMDGQL